MAEGLRILVDPQPRSLDLICDAGVRARLDALGEVIEYTGPGRMPADQVDAALPTIDFLMGQTDLPRERLDRAPRLKGIVNIEGNFAPNVDYSHCFARGIRVLVVSPAFVYAVAEAGLGMAIDLMRGISRADRAMRAGTEAYGLEANAGCALLAGQPVGFVGFGDIARELMPLLAPFKCPVKVYDPWLPADLLRAQGAEPADLDEVLATSRIVFVVAAVTTENQAMIGAAEFAHMQPGSAFILLSRAGVVDFDAFVDAVARGHIVAATDVFPDEPVPADHPVRGLDGMLLSAHRTGGMPEAFKEIGRLAVGDLELMARGLPPVLCRQAQPETVASLRSKPVDIS